MKGWSFNFLFLFFCLIFLSQTVFAAIDVQVVPANGNDVLEIYQGETGTYILYITNLGNEPETNAAIKVNSDQGIEFFDNELNMRSEQIIEPGIIPAGETKTVSFNVKANENAEIRDNYILNIIYGLGSYTHFTGTIVRVTESPLHINTSLSKAAFNPGDDGSLFIDLENKGESLLWDILIEIEFEQGIFAKEKIFSLDMLKPGEKFEGKEFPFLIEPSAQGKSRIYMELFFTDAKGDHFIQKNFSISQENNFEFFVIIVTVIVIVLCVLYLLRGLKKAKQPTVSGPVNEQIPQAPAEEPPEDVPKEDSGEGEMESVLEKDEPEEKKAAQE